eukprot:4683932-Alexandrium_andersonii.AAC.1
MKKRRIKANLDCTAFGARIRASTTQSSTGAKQSGIRASAPVVSTSRRKGTIGPGILPSKTGRGPSGPR